MIIVGGIVLQVMIMELAERVREFLHSYNKPPAKSFHEQMIDKQKRAEKERAQKQHEQQELERRKREEEVSAHRWWIYGNMVDGEREETKSSCKGSSLFSYIGLFLVFQLSVVYV